MKTFCLYLCLFCSFLAQAQEKKSNCCHVLDSINNTTKQATECCCEDDIPAKCFNNNNELIRLTTVLYDFKTKNIAYPDNAKKLKKGNAVRIKVVNFNPFVYKVNIDNHDSSYKASVDAGNILSAFASFSNLPSLVSGIANAMVTPQVTKSNESKNQTELMKDMETTHGFIGSSLLEMVDKHLAAKKENNKKYENIKDTVKENRELTKLRTFYTNQKQRIKNYTATLFNEKEKIDLTLYDWARLFSSERNPYPSCNDFLHLTSGEYIPGIEASFNEIKKEVKSCSIELEDEQQNYLDTIALFNDVFKNAKDDSYKILDSLLKTYYTQASIQLFKIDSLLSYQSLQQLVESLDRIKGLKPCYTSPPLFLTGDSKTINLQIKPWKDTMPYQTDAPIIFELPWQQKHIWGVSAGIYGSSLHNNIYSTKTTINGTDTTYTLLKDNAGKGEFGINALAYTGTQISNDWYLGYSFGAGFSIESKPKPRVFTGISFIKGEQNRILFSGGLTAGFVQRLSAAYADLSMPSHVFPTVVTKDAIRLSGFISINYSFLGN